MGEEVSGREGVPRSAVALPSPQAPVASSKLFACLGCESVDVDTSDCATDQDKASPVDSIAKTLVAE